MRTALTALLILLTCTAALADEFGLEPAASAEPTDEILLKDGTLLTGRIVEVGPDFIVFETDSLGRMEIPRANIARFAEAGGRVGVRTDPDYNSLMFCPTPATLEKGDHYFRDFELFVLNFGASLTDDLDLSVGTLFPISSEVLMVSVGAKYRVVDRREKPVGVAFTGSWTSLEEIRFGSFGLVAGAGDKHRSLNVSVNRTYDDDGDTETAWILGGDLQVSNRTKLFCEFMSTATLLEDEDEDLEGFLNLGIRLFGDSHSFSLSGFRPLGTDSGSLIAWPMIMYSNHF